MGGFHPEDIPFDALPQRFVIKVTHGSTFNIICTDKSRLDRQDTIKKCNKWLKAKFLPAMENGSMALNLPESLSRNFLKAIRGCRCLTIKFFVSMANREWCISILGRIMSIRLMPMIWN